MGIQFNGNTDTISTNDGTLNVNPQTTFGGEVGIAGTLTYEDVTNVDSVGVITARDGLRVTGIATATAFHGDGSQLTGITTAFGNSSVNTSGIITATAFIPSSGQLSHRNLYMNGAMRVNQRGDATGKTSSGFYGPDRHRYTIYNGTWSILQQDSGSTLPEFPKCIRFDCTTAGSALSGTQEHKFGQMIEAQDLAPILQYGTASAKTFTISFYVRSNKTETFTLWVYKPDNTARMNAKNFTISAANTWEKKTFTFVGDTDAAGSINMDNGYAFKFEWILAAGGSYTSGTAMNGTWQNLTSADRYVGNTGTIGQSTSDYFDLTGVQMEIGTVATPFEHRKFVDELQSCMRYLI